MFEFRTSKTILEEMLQQKREDYLKRAADVKKTFEENFQQLTDAILMEHFPKLRKYDLGFQLVDKSDDNSKGIGIRAFRLRSLAFMPFFYDNGMVGGYEMLFLPRENIFLPTSEEWIAYLTSKVDSNLGKATDKVKEVAVIGMPNLLPLRRPMIFKMGSAQKVLPEAVRRHQKLAQALVVFCDSAPFVVQHLVDHYGVDFVKEAIAIAKQPPRPTYDYPLRQRLRDEKLQVYSSRNAPLEILGPQERYQLEKKGYLIRDKRAQTEVSRAIPQTTLARMVPVDSPGFYRVATRTEIHEVLVLRDIATGELVAFDMTDNVMTTIPTASRVMNRNQPVLANADTLNPAGGLYAVERGDDTAFREALERFLKRFRHNPPYRGYDLMSDDRKNTLAIVGQDGRCIVQPQRFVATPGRVLAFSSRYGEVVIPDDAVVVRKPAWESETFEDYFNKVRGLNPIKDMTEGVIKGDVDKLNIKYAHPYYVCNDRPLERADAVIHLVRDWGFRESDANEMLDAAKTFEKVAYFVKRGDDWLGNMTGMLANRERPAIIFPEPPRGEFAPGYRSESRLEVDLWVPGLKRPLPIVSYLDPPEIKHIQIIKQLADANNGEAFDVGMLAAILNVSDAKAVVDEYIPVILKGLDGVGRVLFAMYRHKDALRDRYGKDDYVVCLDKLKTNFKNLGDLVVRLMQRDVDSVFEDLANLESLEER